MRFTVSFFFLIFISSLFAQSNHNNISFSEYVYDFSYINEIDGEVEHTFHFINKGKEPFSILEVVSECGCTVPLYTEGMVQPGDSGVVKAIFNPQEPVGKEFDKTLTVRVTNDTALIKIKGHIIPIERAVEEAVFTKRMGDTWFRSSYFQFGKMTNNKVYTKEFDFYNSSTDSLGLSSDSIPDFLMITMEPKIVAPKTVGLIKIQYDPKKKNDYGYFTDDIELTSTEDTLAVKKMHISGNIAEYFPDSLDLEQAPKAVQTTEAKVNLGTIMIDTPKQASFKLKNEGKEVLIIRKISSPCSCISVDATSGLEIQPGEEATFDATFDGAGRRKGNVSKSFYLYVNDPVNSILKFTIKATVK